MEKLKMPAKICYLFLLPFLIVFTLFYIVPVVMSMALSFTYYNVLEPPTFIALKNYTNLFFGDDVFITAVKNTFILAVVTGPVGYLSAFIFAWFINDLPKKIRAIAVLVFYAPTISGQVYFIFTIFFSSDSYGYFNAWLMRFGIITEPVFWLTNPKYMMWVIVLVVLWMSLGAGFLSFVAGLQNVDKAQIEAGCIDGIKNRWQELWYITLPNMKPMLLFGAVMTITQTFGVGEVTMALAGFPSTDYAARTVVTHLFDYGVIRFDMGYASAIATILFLTMYLCNKLIQKILSKLGT